MRLAGLTPDEAVLEPGCGAGRIAEPLTRYLSEDGSYDGFDVVAEAIESCKRGIASRHPNFHFRHVDVFNRDIRYVLNNVFTVWFFLAPIVYPQRMTEEHLEWL